MSRISGSQRTQRIHQSYVNRMTNISNADYVERVERLDPTSSSNNEGSENFLLSYDRFYKTISELKSELKQFYHFKLLQEDQSTQQFVGQTTTFIYKYNKLISALRQFDKINKTNYVKTFHSIYEAFSESLTVVGISEKDDYTLTIDLAKLIECNVSEAVDRIQQFKDKIVQEYQSFYDSTEETPFVLKGLIIEEMG